MNVELSPKVVKYLSGLDNPLKRRIQSALKKLEKEPPEGDIKSLVGKDGYRARVGQYRILFDRIEDRIVVYEIVSTAQLPILLLTR